MPDIGLLGGSLKARVVPPLPMVSETVEPVVAHFIAPVAAAPVAVVSAEIPAPAAVKAASTPRVPRVLAAPPPIRTSDLLWLALALLIMIGTGLGIRDPWPADEPRFAVIARDMVATGEWLFPHVGGDLYQDKPPFFFWLLAVGYSVIGSIKWSFLLPAFCAAGGVLFLVYDLGRRLVGREAGFAAALVLCFTLQFIMVFRGAQIDPVLCFLTTLSLYALLRHMLLGPAWRWYVAGGFAAGVGVFTKGVGFLPLLLLIPFFVLRGFRWQGLAPIDAGKGGWRWWLAPLAMLCAISLWFVPMLVAVASSGAPEYAAYRDEILFKQTVGRYAASWHHVKAWYYFIVEVVPPLWVPFSLLLFWLVPRFKAAFRERDARVWLPLTWLLLVVLFFSLSPGKRGVYITPALPALAIASFPFIQSVLERAGVRRTGAILGSVFFVAAAAFTIACATQAKFAVDALAAANLSSLAPLYLYLLLCGAGLVYAFARAPLAAWPAAIGSLAVVFSWLIAPAMNGEHSARDFTHAMLAQVGPGEELALVAYKEQFLLYLDRPILNFGHRRVFEGPQESYDASAWVNAAPSRVLLVPADQIKPCFEANAAKAGITSDEEWFLVRAPAARSCAEKGDANRAIHYKITERWQVVRTYCVEQHALSLCS
jgi:4-amino-4-deoxy-L-arabinose transferase-like glycosyltransferase